MHAWVGVHQAQLGQTGRWRERWGLGLGSFAAGELLVHESHTGTVTSRCAASQSRPWLGQASDTDGLEQPSLRPGDAPHLCHLSSSVWQYTGGSGEWWQEAGDSRRGARTSTLAHAGGTPALSASAAAWGLTALEAQVELLSVALRDSRAWHRL